MFHDPRRLEQPLPLAGQQALTRALQARDAQIPQQGAALGGQLLDGMVQQGSNENTLRAAAQGAQPGQSSALALDRGQQLAQAAKAHLQAYTEQQQGAPLAGKAALRALLGQRGLDPATTGPAQLAQLIGMA